MVPRIRFLLAALLGAGLLAGVFATGCGRKSIRTSLLPNKPPVVILTNMPIDSDSTVSYTYVVRANWLGYDEDGRVDYYEYAILPGGASIDTVSVWTRTARNEETFFFSSTKPDSIVPGITTLSDAHTFIIRAVDNQGARSAPAWRSFWSYTVAPNIRIVGPQPESLLVRKLPPSVYITWAGDDLDGERTKKPVRYKFKLYSVTELEALGIDPNHPVEFNRFAPDFKPDPNDPSTWWETVSGDTTFKLITDLVPGREYVFVVTGFDEAGAYDPVFTRKTNVLRFLVTYSSTLGPQLCIFNEYIAYCYGSGGYATDDSRYVRLEVPAQQSVCWNWFGIASEGALVKRTRWKLDTSIELTDETPRTDENLDLVHWSRWQSAAATPDDANRACLPTFNGAPCGADTIEKHTLFIEMEDNIGLKSLGIVEFAVIPPCFTPGDSRMLIVDDRRGPADEDRLAPVGVMDPPKGSWPTEAELDTFLFAVGGKPWKTYNPANCPGTTPNCPTTQLNSPPGIFAGYPFDTLDTRRGLIDITMPLSILSRYYNVLWYTDGLSANILLDHGAIGEPPLTSLVWMNQPNRANTLVIFTRQGGRLFFFGGGVAAATLYAWVGGRLPVTWEAGGSRPVLIPGRFIYDYLKFQADAEVQQASFILPHERRSARAAGLIPMGLFRPAVQSGLDPMPPYRVLGDLPRLGLVEEVTKPLYVVEDTDPGANVNEVSVIDSLFRPSGGTAKTDGVCGWFYHSRSTPPLHGDLLFLGFDLWSWRRSQIIANLDLLLNNFFGISRTTTTTAMRSRRRE